MQEINTFQSESDLQELISNKRTESLTLEYKRASALSNSSSIVKQVTAMANASGGTIIYGLAEDDEKLYPANLDPVDFSVYTKEAIENKIIDNSDPRFTGLKITQVETKESSSHGYYVINIEKSTTAHQNTIDNKYYIRRNFKSEPMLDYEIEDIKRRNKFPKFTVEFMLRPRQLVSGITSFMGAFMPVTITNTSEVYAKYIVLKISSASLFEPPSNIDEIQLFATNHNSLEDFRTGKYKLFENPIPILPGCSHTWQLPLCKYINSNENLILQKFSSKTDNQMVYWKLYADNAKPEVGEFWLGDLIRKYINIFSQF